MAPVPASERLLLIPAINKRNTTGYKNVAYDRGSKKFKAQVQDGGKCVHLGSFATAEEAATAYARSEYGRADAAKLLQPRATTTAAGAAAILQAAREGLKLVASSSSNSGYRGVTFKPKERGSKKYKLTVKVGRKDAVRQAEREGLTLVTSSNSNSGYRGVTFKQGSKKYELTAVRQAGREVSEMEVEAAAAVAGMLSALYVAI
ncbi:hypothetical protein EMIHUDRAFT_225200 [Emiliania huxleyi CCMP1516]|uniref:AP2/ERF domain-containing protein n=2 Tax=Emiliania huxleyi TaxID=2903 RepID=A0A0D3KPF2_EMIH1|nr:hypothetical protein EMIHUDRAFT_225200 [Emiliania huxleyi CCMP1516]EOD37637.1 hypothetical protein EMIHUDRAFT_225200 [Emiliania huxleyi CCMP1516]|eukprot:XP_005790066.1 hypothetical protein EMIHUDRAFT_225200 [Emiliania huxleyi CCMP1516]